VKPGDLVEFKRGAYMLRRFVLSSDGTLSMSLGSVLTVSATPTYTLSFRDVGDSLDAFETTYILTEFALDSDSVLELEFKEIRPLPPKPVDVFVKRRSPAQILRGRYPLSCGCVIKKTETCEHGWTVTLWL
jgi:hypothetical protein